MACGHNLRWMMHRIVHLLLLPIRFEESVVHRRGGHRVPKCTIGRCKFHVPPCRFLKIPHQGPLQVKKQTSLKLFGIEEEIIAVSVATNRAHRLHAVILSWLHPRNPLLVCVDRLLSVEENIIFGLWVEIFVELVSLEKFLITSGTFPHGVFCAPNAF